MLAERFRAELASRQIRFAINGSSNHTLPGAMNISLVGCKADDIVERLASEVAISSGSACSSGQIDTAPALRAMHLTEDMAQSSVRIYFHRYSTAQDAVDAARLIAEAVRAVGLATGDVVQ
jgi:cysteine desulfurase